MATVEQKEVRLPLGVVVERRRSSHPWADVIWKPVSVYLEGATRRPPWTVLVEGDGVTRYHAGTVDLVLHRKETEALRLNLMLEHPEIYVVLQQDSGAFPWVPHLVTASSYESQDWEDPGDQIVEKVAMPEAVAAFISAFVEVHHVEVPFRKRKRTEHVSEERQFSKHPIFLPVIKQ